MDEPRGVWGHGGLAPVADLAPRLSWSLLGTLGAAAILLHEWSAYPVVLGALTLAAVALCLLSERASVILFAGSHALDAYGFITHVPVSISVARIVVVAVVAGAALRWALTRPRPRLDLQRSLTVWDAGVLVFLAGAVVSVPFTYSLPLSVVGVVHVAFLIGAYFVVSRAVLSTDARDDLFITVIAAGVVTSLVALGQAFVPGFPVEVLRATSSAEAVRASGFFDNPNTMALLLVLTVLFAAERVWGQTRSTIRWLYASAALLGLVAIGVSYSRAAFVGIVVGGVVLAALLIRRARDRAIALVALGVVLAAVLSLPGVGARAESILDFRGDASAMDRVYLAQVSLEMFADRPLNGVGIQAFRAAYPAYEDSRVTIDPVTDGHQMPASVPAEVGILGLLAEIVLAGALVWVLGRSLAAAHVPRFPTGIGVMAAISAMAFFNTFIFFESLWIGSALLGAEFVALRRERSAS